MSSTLEFPDLFDIEIEGWCIGIEENKDSINNKEILHLISELTPLFHSTLQKNYVFDLVDVAKQFNEACEDKVNLKTLTYYILALMPHPKELNEAESETLNNIILDVEKKYIGTTVQMQKRWDSQPK